MHPKNLKPVSIAEKLLFCTIRIEAQTKAGGVSTGTGFFYNHSVNDKHSLPLIITNKHVIGDAHTGSFHVHLSDKSDPQAPSGIFKQFTVRSFNNHWIDHPESSVDLCAMPIQPLIHQVEQTGEKVFSTPLSTKELPNAALIEELSALDEIVMPGYPIGIWDMKNNMPIIRRGAIASHPNLDFCGKSEFLADIACFPGSSGSPVLLYNAGMHPVKAGGVQLGDRFALLGVNYARPRYLETGAVKIDPIPTELRGSAEIYTGTHLAYIIKAEQVVKLCEHVCAVLKIKTESPASSEDPIPKEDKST